MTSSWSRQWSSVYYRWTAKSPVACIFLRVATRKHHPETLGEENPIDRRIRSDSEAAVSDPAERKRARCHGDSSHRQTRRRKRRPAGTHHGHVVAHVHDRLEPGEHRRRVLHVFHDHDDLERGRVPGVLAGLRVHVQSDHLQPVHVSGLEVQRPGHGYRAGGRVLVGARPADGQLRRALRSHRRCKRHGFFTFTRWCWRKVKGQRLG